MDCLGRMAFCGNSGARSLAAQSLTRPCDIDQDNWYWQQKIYRCAIGTIGTHTHIATYTCSYLLAWRERRSSRGTGAVRLCLFVYAFEAYHWAIMKLCRTDITLVIKCRSGSLLLNKVCLYLYIKFMYLYSVIMLWV